MVTVEDLLEEIVGEIQDEHDEVVRLSDELSDGGWRVDGRLPLEALEDLCDVEVEEERYETVGGLIFGHLGYVPETGEELTAHGLRFKVENVEGRGIKTVLVRVAPGETDHEQG